MFPRPGEDIFAAVAAYRQLADVCLAGLRYIQARLLKAQPNEAHSAHHMTERKRPPSPSTSRS